MAAQNHDHNPPAMDYAEHEKTFSLFASLMKWGTVLSIFLLMLVGSIWGPLPWAFTLIVTALSIGIVAKFF
jgi:hypothetical protein